MLIGGRLSRAELMCVMQRLGQLASLLRSLVLAPGGAWSSELADAGAESLRFDIHPAAALFSALEETAKAAGGDGALCAG